MDCLWCTELNMWCSDIDWYDIQEAECDGNCGGCIARQYVE